MKSILRKLPFFSKLYALAEQVTRQYERIRDLESSLGEIILGLDPAETLLKHYCRCSDGRAPDLTNPRSFNEKILWLNLYDNNPLKKVCADKFSVRQYVAEKIGDEYLIPSLGVWNSFDEIDFSQLPEQFVLKPTHASGCNIIVKDKKKMNMAEMKKHFDYWLSVDYSRFFLEKCYQGIPRRILAETYIKNDDGDDLLDYKFFCIHGDVKLCWVDLDRSKNHKRNVYDTEWNLLPLTIQYPSSSRIVKKPDNFTSMLEIAKKLSSPFYQVRVDLYNHGGKIYFGELTFVSGAGWEIFTPDSYNYKLGEMLHLPEKRNP